MKEILIILISLIAAFAVFLQIKEGTEVSRAEFIMNLQQTYSNTEGFADIFQSCWKNYTGEKTYEETYAYLRDHRNELLNYLTFFESMYLMKEQGVLNMELLDELFGRRFFIVVNNKAVQDIDLVKNHKYYMNVIFLFRDWSAFRKHNAKKMPDPVAAERDMFICFSKEQSRDFRVLTEALKKTD